DLRHARAGPELELLGLLVEDRQAGDVRRQEIGRELDPPERAAEAPGARLGGAGLAGPRHGLAEQTAATHARDERESDLVVLADDDALDVREDLLAGLLDLGHDGVSPVWRLPLATTGRAGPAAHIVGLLGWSPDSTSGTEIGFA